MEDREGVIQRQNGGRRWRLREERVRNLHRAPEAKPVTQIEEE